MKFTEEHLEIINSENPKVLFELAKVEVLAIYSLGQMHNKIVRKTDVFGNVRVGLFVIESINGKSDLNFSKPDEWRDIKIDEIFFSIISPNEYGSVDKITTNNLFDVESIALLDKPKTSSSFISRLFKK